MYQLLSFSVTRDEDTTCTIVESAKYAGNNLVYLVESTNIITPKECNQSANSRVEDRQNSDVVVTYLSLRGEIC